MTIGIRRIDNAEPRMFGRDCSTVRPEAARSNRPVESLRPSNCLIRIRPRARRPGPLSRICESPSDTGDCLKLLMLNVKLDARPGSAIADIGAAAASPSQSVARSALARRQELAEERDGPATRRLQLDGAGILELHPPVRD